MKTHIIAVRDSARDTSFRLVIPPLQSAIALSPGTRLGAYEVPTLIGSVGMGGLSRDGDEAEAVGRRQDRPAVAGGSVVGAIALFKPVFNRQLDKARFVNG